jgi:hypothetical protein
MKFYRPLGIFFIALGAVMIVAGILVTDAILGLIGGGVSLILVGVLFVWMHGFMKDVKMPGGSIAGGFSQMSAGATQANQFLKSMASKGETASALLTNGVDASATINKVTDTGAMMNFNPVVELELMVFPKDGRPPYPVTTRETVPRMSMALVAPGKQVPCRVDPSDQSKILVQL